MTRHLFIGLKNIAFLPLYAAVVLLIGAAIELPVSMLLLLFGFETQAAKPYGVNSFTPADLMGRGMAFLDRIYAAIPPKQIP